MCPCHDDHDPSLTLTVKNERLLVWCRGCHATGKEVAPALGLRMGDLFVGDDKPQNVRIVAEYSYTDEKGTELFQAVRKEYEVGGEMKKSFAYRHRAFDDQLNDFWQWDIRGVKRVLYNLKRIVETREKDAPIFIVEGEKCADAVIKRFGLVATCNPCGAGQWRDEYAEVLTGRKCVVLPDNDESGKDHAMRVCGSLLVHKAKEVRIALLPGLPEKGDVEDWIRAGHTKAEFVTFVTDQPAMSVCCVEGA